MAAGQLLASSPPHGPPYPLMRMSMPQQCCSKPFTDMLLGFFAELQVTTYHMNRPRQGLGQPPVLSPSNISCKLNADEPSLSLTLLILFSYLDGLIQGFRKPASQMVALHTHDT